jgi:hypothetical protein
MHEHGREERGKITDGIRQKAAGNKSPLPDESVTTSHLDKEEQDVHSDQYIRDQGKNPAGGIIITNGEHSGYLLINRLEKIWMCFYYLRNMYAPMIMNGMVNINSFGKQLDFFDLALPDQTCFCIFCLEALLLDLIPLPDDWDEVFLDGRSFLTLCAFDLPGMAFSL